MSDYVSEILSQVSGLGAERGMYDDEVSGDPVDSYINSSVAGLVEVGALTEVGAAAAKRVMKGAAVRARQGAPQARPQGADPGRNPSPTFAVSSRDTERRGPLGFVEDATGKNSFTLSAAIGASTTMRAKVSRVAHINRLLIQPSDPGAVIDSIKIGDEEQALAMGAPVELYGPEAMTDTEMDNFSPIGPGLDVIITLRNTTAGAITGTIGCKCTIKR